MKIRYIKFKIIFLSGMKGIPESMHCMPDFLKLRQTKFLNEKIED